MTDNHRRINEALTQPLGIEGNFASPDTEIDNPAEADSNPERAVEIQERMTREVVSGGIVGAAAVELSVGDEGSASPDKSWLQRSKERAERIGKFLGQGTRLPAKVLKSVRDNPLLYGAAAVSSWVFEIGPWNEAVRLDLGFEVFDRTLDALKTGAAIGLATIPIEMIPATLVAWGLSRENMPGRKAMRWMHEKLGAGDGDSEIEAGKKSRFEAAKDISLALGVGAAAVIAKRFFTQETSFKEEIKTAARLSLAIATFSGAVGWVTVYGILNAEGTPFEGAADFLERNGTDAKFWLAVFGGLQVAGMLGKLITGRKDKSETTSENNQITPTDLPVIDGWMQVPSWNTGEHETSQP